MRQLEPRDPDRGFDWVERAWNQCRGRATLLCPPQRTRRQLPAFCLKIPTGGGKTLLATRVIDLVNRHVRRSRRGLVLWIVPTLTDDPKSTTRRTTIRVAVTPVTTTSSTTTTVAVTQTVRTEPATTTSTVTTRAEAVTEPATTTSAATTVAATEPTTTTTTRPRGYTMPTVSPDTRTTTFLTIPARPDDTNCHGEYRQLHRVRELCVLDRLQDVFHALYRM